MKQSIKIPKLLCPAGDIICLKTAVDFGADAVYLAGEEFGMRTASSNFGEADMAEGIKYAHDHGVKVHITCNTIPHNDEIPRLPAFLEQLNALGADAIIASDFGTINAVKKYAPNVKLHASVQSGITNYATANAFYDMGADCVVLARELTLEEIAEIREKTNKNLEIECFAHGALCMSFSARCLLSSYMTGRDANRGDCAQPCRWSYSLMEEKRPGQYFDITETDKGTYIFNSDDLCMAPHIDKLALAGVDTLKIEGRAKSNYYVAVTSNAYRGALDSLKSGSENWILPNWVNEELDKISHRNYSTGFYYGRPENAQNPKSAGYVRNYSVAAVVDGYEDGMLVVSMRNKFLKGQEFDCLEAGSEPFSITANEMFNEENEPINEAPHPMMTVKIPFERKVKTGSMLRMKAE